ncbi:hypothetical protein Tco_0266420 [Tanacetum coccineum]
MSSSLPTKGKKAKIVIPDDPFKHGRMEETEYEDEEELVSEDPSKRGRMEETEYADVEEENAGVAAKILAEASKERVKTYNRRRGSTDSSQVSTAVGLVSTAKDIQDTDEEQTKALEQQEQERANFEAALKLQKQFDQERKEADNIDWNKLLSKYQAFKKKLVTVAQARKKYNGIFEEHGKLQAELFQMTAQALGSEAFQEQSTEETKECSEEDLKTLLEIVPVEEFRIIRVSNITEAYQSFEDMLKAFDREDLDTLWSLVKEKFRSVEPNEDMERALWVELKRLYEPDKKDTLWKLQRYMHDPLTWRLYGSCVVHHVFSTRGHCIYMLPEKDYPLTTEVIMLMLSRRLQVEEDSEMARDLVKKIFIEANRSRR